MSKAKNITDSISDSIVDKLGDNVKDKISSLIEPYTKKLNKAKKIGGGVLITAISISTIKKAISIMDRNKLSNNINGGAAIRKARKLQEECEDLERQIKAGLITEKQAIARHEQLEKRIVKLLEAAEAKGYYVAGRTGMVNESTVLRLKNTDNEVVRGLLEKIEIVTEASVIPGMDQVKKRPQAQGKPVSPSTGSAGGSHDDKATMDKLVKKITHLANTVSSQAEKIEDGATKEDLRKMSATILKKAREGNATQEDLTEFKKKSVRAVNALKDQIDNTDKRIEKVSKLVSKKTSEMEEEVKKSNVAAVAAIALSSAALLTTVCTSMHGYKERKAQKLLSQIRFYKMTIKSIQEQVKSKTLTPGEASLKIKAIQAKMDKAAKDLMALKPDLDARLLKESAMDDCIEIFAEASNLEYLDNNDIDFLLEFVNAYI